MALSLGARVDLVTRLTDDYDRMVLDGIHVIASPARQTCRYANSYAPNGDRKQLLLAEGEPLTLSSRHVAGADALMLAPAYHELAGGIVRAGLLTAVSLQGPLRTRTAADEVVPHPEPLAASAPFVAEGAFAFLSEEDTADAMGLAHELAARGATTFVTRGYRGATVVAQGSECSFEAIPARPSDPTGAGDCFATAFLVRMAETGDLRAACRFALAAGSLAVEGVGLAGVPARRAVEERLEEVAA
jgi:sugar/nucleoside kinase (ribokinase family)